MTTIDTTESELGHGIFNLTFTLLQNKMLRMSFKDARRETETYLQELIRTLQLTDAETMEPNKEDIDNG